MTAAPESRVRVLTWNISHGLDDPPDRGLLTWRSRLLRVTETNATHAQVNRPLLPEVAAVLACCEWDVALLQEAPPRWLRALARETGAGGAASALTARNFAAPLRRWLADRNADLMGSREGGSNQLLVRPPWRIAEVRRATLTRMPERRRLLWALLRGPGDAELAVANMHLSAGDSPKAGREALLAAEHAVGWAGDAPLVFGGDFNAPDSFEELRECFELIPEPGSETIEHLLGRGLALVEAPRALPPEAREVAGVDGRRLRPSDHPPVVGCFGIGPPGGPSDPPQAPPRARESSPDGPHLSAGPRRRGPADSGTPGSR